MVLNKTEKTSVKDHEAKYFHLNGQKIFLEIFKENTPSHINMSRNN